MCLSNNRDSAYITRVRITWVCISNIRVLYTPYQSMYTYYHGLYIKHQGLYIYHRGQYTYHRGQYTRSEPDDKYNDHVIGLHKIIGLYEPKNL